MATSKSAEEITLEHDMNVVDISGQYKNVQACEYASSSLKRGMDILISVPGLLILAVGFIPIAIAILVNSRGPLFYRQTRLGLGGRPFTLLKFRTMRNSTNEESWGSRTKRDDPRVTAIGSILRKFYLDEFPQFWNVLIGQMSIVGPRPEIQAVAESIMSKHPRFKRRLAVKPGITGPAQIYYIYAENERDAWRRYYYDVDYVRKCSFSMDLFMTFRTLIRLIRHRGQ